MSKGIIKEFSFIRLKPADNGFILSYDEIIEFPGTMKGRDHRSREIVFGDSAEDLDVALSKMKELLVFNKNKDESKPIAFKDLTIALGEDLSP